MIQQPYSLVIEATEDPEFFGFFPPDLEGFTGAGHSIEDCLYRARWGMDDFVRTLVDLKLPVPERNADPTVVIQNDRRLKTAWNARRYSWATDPCDSGWPDRARRAHAPLPRRRSRKPG